MKILLTGNKGYIGPVMTKLLKERGHEIRGFDTNYFEGCNFFKPIYSPNEQIIKDLRDIEKDDLNGVNTVIHLAGLSNDPLGEINPCLTEDINYRASIRLADIAKEVQVKRFIFASSCSIYGIAATDKAMTENDDLNPITAYAKSKILFERYLAGLADEKFHPVFMRNATVYGVSPELRLDLVVNNLVAGAYLTGEINVMSDGTPWRPIVHIEDFARAFIVVLEAPEDKIHCQAINVGINEENYQIRYIAEEIKKILPNCNVNILSKTGHDERTYRVDFSKIKNTLNFKPQWDLKRGIEELLTAYRLHHLTMEDFYTDKYFRVRALKHLIDTQKINSNLYWI